MGIWGKEMTRAVTLASRPFRGYVALTVKGFCMGAADVVPGVSGGTMAFILNIYEELIASIRAFDLDLLKVLMTFRVKDAIKQTPWQFLGAVGTGILMAIFTLARVLSWLLENRPVLIWSFFFGLIVASVFSVSRHCTRRTPFLFALVGCGAVFTYFLVGMVPASTPNTPWFLFISGAIAICAMILPGVSGAFILVLLGKYHYVLEAVNNRDIMILFLIGSGAVVGLVTFARFLGWLFNRYHDSTIAILTGLMLGSLRKVWPWKQTLKSVADVHGDVAISLQRNVLPHWPDREIVAAICLALLGFLIVFVLNWLGEKGKQRMIRKETETASR
jgi:putative membrane protein